MEEEKLFGWEEIGNSLNATLFTLNRSFNSEEMVSTSTGKTLFSTGENNEENHIITQNNNDIENNREETSGLPRKIIFKHIKRMKMGRSSKECSICFGKFKRGELIRKLPCKHIFHESCIIIWLLKKIKCPNCRFDLKEHFDELFDENN